MWYDEYKDYFLLSNGEVVQSYNSVNEDGEKEYDRVYEEDGQIYFIKEGSSYKVVKMADSENEIYPTIKVYIVQPRLGRDKNERQKKKEQFQTMLRELFSDKRVKFEEPFSLYDDRYPLWYLGTELQHISSADVVFFEKGWDEEFETKIQHECALKYNKAVIAEYSEEE